MSDDAENGRAQRAEDTSHETPGLRAGDGGAGVVQPAGGPYAPVPTGEGAPLPPVTPPAPAREPQIVYGYPVGPPGRYQPSVFAAWWNRRSTVYLVVFVVLALVAATLALAVHALTRVPAQPAPLGQATPTPSPPRESSTAPPVSLGTPTPESSPTNAPAPEGTAPAADLPALPPVPPGTIGDPYTSGVVTLEPDDVYDLDTDSAFAARWSSDIAVTRQGITGLNAVPLSVYGTGEVPRLADCAATAPEDWVLTVPPEQLTPGTHICYFTDRGNRYGYLTVQDSRFTTSGGLDLIQFAYLVWKGADDT